MSEQTTQVEQVEVDGWRIDPHPTDGFEIIDSRNVFIAGAIQSKRHANLIAAAPELLAVLKSVEWSASVMVERVWFSACPACFHRQNNGHRKGCQLHATILKAEGK